MRKSRKRISPLILLDNKPVFEPHFLIQDPHAVLLPLFYYLSSSIDESLPELNTSERRANGESERKYGRMPTKTRNHLLSFTM